MRLTLWCFEQVALDATLGPPICFFFPYGAAVLW